MTLNAYRYVILQACKCAHRLPEQTFSYLQCIFLYCSAIAVRGNTVSGLEILVSENGTRDCDNVESDLITETQWSLLRQKFKRVNLTKMAGRGFMNKIELLLAVYGGRVR